MSHGDVEEPLSCSACDTPHLQLYQLYMYIVYNILYRFIYIARFALPVVTLLTFTSLASRLFIGLTPIFASGKFREILNRRRRLEKT